MVAPGSGGLKSDHFGIEMIVAAHAPPAMSTLKSDHFGIEI